MDFDSVGIFESSDVIEIVGIRAIYLNKFVERRLYGIEASARPGEGRGSRRWFSLDDVFAIALVWWLFEAGLRTQVIKRLLQQIGKSSKADAKTTAKRLVESGTEFLVITRRVRLTNKKDHATAQVVDATDSDGVQSALQDAGDELIHVLPVKKLFTDLLRRMREFATRRSRQSLAETSIRTAERKRT